MMHAVATQGKDYSWVQAYKLSYGNDGSNFKFVLADKSTYPRVSENISLMTNKKCPTGIG